MGQFYYKISPGFFHSPYTACYKIEIENLKINYLCKRLFIRLLNYFRKFRGFEQITPIRREFLDQTLFWNAVDLEKKLGVFQEYYNHSRLHALLKGDTPAQTSGESKTKQADLEHNRWQAHCYGYGLVQLPLAA